MNEIGNITKGGSVYRKSPEDGYPVFIFRVISSILEMEHAIFLHLQYTRLQNFHNFTTSSFSLIHFPSSSASARAQSGQSEAEKQENRWNSKRSDLLIVRGLRLLSREVL